MNFDDEIILVELEDRETFFRYYSHYLPPGASPAAGAVCLSGAINHIALPWTAEEVLEPIIAHEMVHYYLSHRPIPLWLNEGLAQRGELMMPGAEDRISGRLKQTPSGWQWTPEYLQYFWTGQSFSIPGEISYFSYVLAAHLLDTLPGDPESIAAFVRNAAVEDAGAQAAREHLGVSLGEVVASLLGEGDWEPQLPLFMGEELEDDEGPAQEDAPPPDQ